MLKDFSQIAASLLTNYDNHTPEAVLSGLDTLTIAEAYQIQRLVVEMRNTRGEKNLGFKIGCTSTSIQQQLGVSQPVYGRLFQSEYHRTGVGLSASHYRQLAIEGELAVRLKTDLPRGLLNDQDIYQAIDAVFPVLELHNYFFRDSLLSAQELIVNNALHAGFVVPALFSSSPISTEIEMTIHIDGKIVDSAKGEVLSQGIFKGLRWLANNLPQETDFLPAGSLVLTGSITRLIPVYPQNHLLIAAPPYGAVTATITP